MYVCMCVRACVWRRRGGRVTSVELFYLDQYFAFPYILLKIFPPASSSFFPAQSRIFFFYIFSPPPPPPLPFTRANCRSQRPMINWKKPQRTLIMATSTRKQLTRFTTLWNKKLLEQQAARRGNSRVWQATLPGAWIYGSRAD